MGSELYRVEISIKKMTPPHWAEIRKACAGGVASVIELLQGRLSNAVMAIITHRQKGLFPHPAEITMECSCPDWATMCKHVAATLYGVGVRLDDKPELMFVLRGVDHLELIGEAAQAGRLAKTGAVSGLAESELSEVFGVDVEPGPIIKPKPKVKEKSKAKAKSKTRGGEKAVLGGPTGKGEIIAKAKKPRIGKASKVWGKK